MESIFNQYKSVTEGKLGQAQFLRNAKMALPKFISNVTSFNDAVTILKNKGIITEDKAADPMEYGVPNDWCDPNEYDLGMRYELGKGTDVKKADKIVCKNLADRKYYYSQLYLAGYDESAMKIDRKKRTDLEVPVGKDNFIDTENGDKKVKLDKLTEDEMIVLVGNILNELDFSSRQLPEDPKKEIASIGNLLFGVNVLAGDSLPDPYSDSSTSIRDQKDLDRWRTNKDPELEVIIDRTKPWYARFIIPAYEEGRNKASDAKLSFYQSNTSRYKGD